MSELRVRTEPLGGGELARIAISGTAPHWFATRATTAEGWERRVREVAATNGGREWASRLAPALQASGAAAQRLDRVVRDGGVVVTTGQQPGLFGGPIYTWSKALSALALADALERATGVGVLPVFWAATDDSDFAEASGTWVAVEGGARRLELPAPVVDGVPLSEVPLAGVDPLLDALTHAAGAAVYPRAIELLRESYRSGATVGSAYLQLLRTVLEPLGIAVLDASHPALRTAADPVLRRALRDAGAIERALDERTRAIEGAGLRPQVPIVNGLSLVFTRAADGTRLRIPVATASRVEADAEAQLGPNVLLRPVLERTLLPTVAYVAGPGELAYFAQVGAVADALGAPTPLGVPRWSGTLLEPHVQRLLAKRELTPDALRDPHAAERALAASLLPLEIRAALDRMRAAVLAETSALGEPGTLPVPDAVPHGFAKATLQRIERLERRYRAAVTRSAAAEFRELATLRGALFPGGERQERRLNLMPTLARHGPQVLDRMLDEARAHAAELVGEGVEAGHAPGSDRASAVR